MSVLLAGLESGMDFIDTADVYCLDDSDIGHNERLIAKVLSEWSGASDVVVATKGGLARPDGAWVCKAHPDALRSACEASLQALGTDAISLYQLHAPDDVVPFADSVGMLARLQEEGKICHVGLSNVSTAQIREAQSIVGVVSVQNRCGPLDCSAWRDGVLAMCERENIAFLPYSPVGGSHGKDRIARHPKLNAIGQRLGLSPFQVTLAWLLGTSSCMVPIPGASRRQNAVDSAMTMSVRLPQADLEDLNESFLG